MSCKFLSNESLKYRNPNTPGLFGSNFSKNK